jgi:hypothetical protein
MKQYNRIALVLLIALMATTALVLIVETQSPTSQLQAQALALPDTTTVITESGGMLISLNGQVTVTFGAATEPATITLSLNVPQTMPTRLNLVGSVFAVEAQYRSSQPMTITVQYIPSPEINENGLTIACYDEIADRWLPLPTAIDTIYHVATAPANQLTRYALVWLEAIQPPPGSVAVVDDLEAGFAQHGSAGGWHSVTNSTTYSYLGHMYWTSNTYSVEDNWATWTPSLVPGDYQVFVFIPWWNTTTENARYQVVHNGQVTEQVVNQKKYYAIWVSVGTYSFGSDPASNYVRLGDVTGEANLKKLIGFDAVAFVQNKVYLPVVIKNYPPPPPIKAKSGIHLGNRSADWTDDMLQPIDGTRGGIFPAVVVVKSEQLYEIWRGGDICEVGSINPVPRAPMLFAYLQRASAAGTKVIIRISPSPGNFQDWNDPSQTNHHLRADNTPAGGTYCELTPGSGTWGFMKYRAVDDIAKEIKQIHNMNKNNDWQEYAFEPANEPNLEWYLKKPFTQTVPTIDQFVAWEEMNDYFVALYDAVKALPDGSNIKLLTPPMAQTRYAEPVRVQDTECKPYRLSDMDTFGYNVMRTVYETKNDGLSWHSYWTYGHESILPYCSGGDGEHISMTFPDWMRDQVMFGSKLAFITESDLASPGQEMGSTLTDKDANTTNTRVSIQYFFRVEPYPVRPVMWLLNNNFDDPPGQHENAEIKWHQAYTPAIGIRPWFTDWWPRPEN